MKVNEHFLSKIYRIFTKITKCMYKPEGKILKFNLVTFAFMGMPLFALEASNLGEVTLKLPAFLTPNRKVIGMNLGTYKIVNVANNINDSGIETGQIKLVENTLGQKFSEALITAEAPGKFFQARQSKKILKAPAVIKALMDDSDVLKPVPEYEGSLDQFEYRSSNIIIPKQNMKTQIKDKTSKSYNKKQILGTAIAAKQCFVSEYSSNRHIFNNNGNNVDLNLVFSDLVSSENQKTIAVIYAKVYSEEFGVDLSNINLYCIPESNATALTYVYENSNDLEKSTYPKKLVILNLGQSGLMMKGLMDTTISTENTISPAVKLTKSVSYSNISGDLIDEAIWKVWAGKIKEVSDINPNTLNMFQKSKCLVELNKVKGKLSAQGADEISASIDLGEDDADFTFTVQELKQALSADNLIENFTKDIKEGVKQMFGEDQDTTDVKFAIVGGSLRIPCLQKAITDLNKDKNNLIQTLNMDEAPAYGGGYFSYLTSNKEHLATKVSTDDINTILKDSHFYTEQNPILQKLFMANQGSTRLSHLRNEVESSCYAVDHIIVDERNKDSKDKKLQELQLAYERLKSCSDRILNNILKNTTCNLGTNMNFLIDIDKCFNKTLLEDCEGKPNQQGVVLTIDEKIEKIDEKIDERIKKINEMISKISETIFKYTILESDVFVNNPDLVEYLKDLKNNNREIESLRESMRLYPEADEATQSTYIRQILDILNNYPKGITLDFTQDNIHKILEFLAEGEVKDIIARDVYRVNRQDKSYRAAMLYNQEKGRDELVDDLLQDNKAVEVFINNIDEWRNSLEDGDLNDFINQMQAICNNNFTSFDMFEILTQIREGMPWDARTAVDIWLLLKEVNDILPEGTYFTNQNYKSCKAATLYNREKGHDELVEKLLQNQDVVQVLINNIDEWRDAVKGEDLNELMSQMKGISTDDNFTSFDMFEILTQIRGGVPFDAGTAVDIWLYTQQHSLS